MNLSNEGRLFNKLGLKSLNHTKDSLPKEREVNFWIPPLDNIEDLFSPEVDIGVLEVEVLLALVEGPRGIFSLLVLCIKVVGEAGHLELKLSVES